MCFSGLNHQSFSSIIGIIMTNVEGRRGINIVVASPRKVVQEGLGKILRDGGHKVHVASSPVELGRILNSADPESFQPELVMFSAILPDGINQWAAVIEPVDEQVDRIDTMAVSVSAYQREWRERVDRVVNLGKSKKDILRALDELGERVDLG